MIWFTSDPHYYHSRVIQYCNRPYDSVEEMNQKMVLNWNSVVKPDDEVYCLGDFSLAFRAIELFSSRLMGKKYLVPGNHDFCHSYHKKSRNKENQAKWIKKYEDNGWIVLPEQTELEIPGVANFQLCHHPYDDGWENDKYAKWRPKNDGRWLLCGHVHDSWTKVGRCINVGVDKHNFTPISIDRILEIMNKEGNF